MPVSLASIFLRKEVIDMLFEILDPIRLDGRVICNSFRINIVPEVQQMRCKITFPQPGESQDRLVDLVITKYETPQIDGIGMSVSFKGKEMKTGTTFDAKIRLELLKRECKFKGKVDGKPFSFDCSSIVEVIEQIGQVMPGASSGITVQGIQAVPVVQTPNQIKIRR